MCAAGGGCGSSSARGLSCHCFVLRLGVLSGRGGPCDDSGDDVSGDDTDDVSDDGGRGGATTGTGSDAIRFWSLVVVGEETGGWGDTCSPAILPLRLLLCSFCWS